MKRIVEVCSAHPSDDGRVNQRSSKALADSGYEVHLIATDPATEPYVQNGVTIHPLPHIPSSRERIKRRAEVARLARSLQPDFYHVHEPELLADVLKVAKSVPVIFDVHELYVDVLLDRDWLPKPARPFVRALWDRYERTLISKCAGVIVVTEGVAARYRAMRDDVVIVANFPDLTDHLATPQPERDGCHCIFSGTLSENRGLLELVAAMGILKKMGSPATLRIAGKGSEGFLAKLESKIAENDVCDRIQVTGPYARLDGIQMSNAASIGMVPHLPYGNNMVAWPVKMLDYMALGLPLIYSDIAPHQELLMGADVGIAVDPTRTECIAEAIQTMIDHPEKALQWGNNGRTLTHTKLNWDVEKRKLIDLVQRLIGR
ncbi:MAG: glycosyltransferase [Armatimonadetes bacterium]|nr:glycosyltransferase [Armatimonadota bacterium]